jgi:uncharacterized protein
VKNRMILAGLLALCAALTLGVARGQEPTLNQVYEAADAGRFGDAQRMMDQVLRDHPNSAKAHYVEAELLAKQGRISAAEVELNNAERLAPGLPFAKPEAVQALKVRIATLPRGGSSSASANASPVAPAASLPAAARGGIPWGMLLLVGAIIAVGVVVVRAMSRRAAAVQSPYAAGGTGMNGYAPQYGPAGPVPPAPSGPFGSGMGSGILGGLATGAAVGVGMVAAESLAHRLMDGHGDAHANPQGFVSSPPDDDFNMGGNDFGVSDASSWDDGGSGGGGGDGGGDWS